MNLFWSHFGMYVLVQASVLAWPRVLTGHISAVAIKSTRSTHLLPSLLKGPYLSLYISFSVCLSLPFSLTFCFSACLSFCLCLSPLFCNSWPQRQVSPSLLSFPIHFPPNQIFFNLSSVAWHLSLMCWLFFFVNYNSIYFLLFSKTNIADTNTSLSIFSHGSKVRCEIHTVWSFKLFFPSHHIRTWHLILQ